MYKIITLILFTLFVSFSCRAAFPVNIPATPELPTVVYENNGATKQQPPMPPAPFGYSKGRSHAVAILLALFGGFLGAHRFYLGYYWHGAIYLLVTAIIVFAVVSTATTSAWILGLLVASTLGTLFGFWVFIDFVRVCTKTLLPKNGDYN